MSMIANVVNFSTDHDHGKQTLSSQSSLLS